MRILGISGSLRHDSHNTQLLRAAARALPQDVELVLYEGLGGIPAFDEDAEADPAESVVEFRRAIDEADAILIATPEYNHSIPGVLKNALDWASRPVKTSVLRNKPAAVIGASTGMFGAVWAQAETRKVCGATGARVLDLELPVGQADGAFSDDGTLADPELQQALADIVAALVAEARPRELASAA